MDERDGRRQDVAMGSEAMAYMSVTGGRDETISVTRHVMNTSLARTK